jgi:hypothetical protein
MCRGVSEKVTLLIMRAMYYKERRVDFLEFLIIQTRTATVIEVYQVTRLITCVCCLLLHWYVFHLDFLRTSI